MSYLSSNYIGSFDQNDDDVGTGIAGAPACGDVMKLQVVSSIFLIFLNTHCID